MLNTRFISTVFLCSALALAGAGCQSTDTVQPAPQPVSQPAPQPAPQPIPQPVTTQQVTSTPSVAASHVTSVTLYRSTEDPLKYCNGADMNSDGYRKTLTKQENISITTTSTSIGELARDVAIASTSGQMQEAFQQMPNDFVVTNGAVHIPAISGWAGVSIALCRAQPEVEVNLSHVPGITSVVWDQ